MGAGREVNCLAQVKPFMGVHIWAVWLSGEECPRLDVVTHGAFRDFQRKQEELHTKVDVGTWLLGSSFTH